MSIHFVWLNVVALLAVVSSIRPILIGVLHPLGACVGGSELADFWRLDFLHFVGVFLLGVSLVLIVAVHHVVLLLLDERSSFEPAEQPVDPARGRG